MKQFLSAAAFAAGLISANASGQAAEMPSGPMESEDGEAVNRGDVLSDAEQRLLAELMRAENRQAQAIDGICTNINAMLDGLPAMIASQTETQIRVSPLIGHFSGAHIAFQKGALHADVTPQIAIVWAKGDIFGGLSTGEAQAIDLKNQTLEGPLYFSDGFVSTGERDAYGQPLECIAQATSEGQNNDIQELACTDSTAQSSSLIVSPTMIELHFQMALAMSPIDSVSVDCVWSVDRSALIYAPE